MAAPMHRTASPTAPKSRSLPGGRAGPAAPATAFGRLATVSKAGSRSTTYGAHRLPSQHPLSLLGQPRVPRSCERRNPRSPGVGSASARIDEDGIEGTGRSSHMTSVPIARWPVSGYAAFMASTDEKVMTDRARAEDKVRAIVEELDRATLALLYK